MAQDATAVAPRRPPSPGDYIRPSSISAAPESVVMSGLREHLPAVAGVVDRVRRELRPVPGPNPFAAAAGLLGLDEPLGMLEGPARGVGVLADALPVVKNSVARMGKTAAKGTIMSSVGNRTSSGGSEMREFSVFHGGQHEDPRWFSTDRQHAGFFGQTRPYRIRARKVIEADPDITPELRGLEGHDLERAAYDLLDNSRAEVLVLKNWEGKGDVLLTAKHLAEIEEIPVDVGSLPTELRQQDLEKLIEVAEAAGDGAGKSELVRVLIRWRVSPRLRNSETVGPALQSFSELEQQEIAETIQKVLRTSGVGGDNAASLHAGRLPISAAKGTP
jgi:hypothetical protein